MTLDLRNFFPSIRAAKVNQYFSRLGYTEEVSQILANLCLYKEALPQGAPTSPMLSNLVVTQLDDELKTLAKTYNADYTRYADDMTFSGNGDCIPLESIKAIVKKHGFKLNQHKTRLRRNGQRQMVTGLTVSNGIHVPKKYRDEVWRELFFCKKFGTESHMSKHKEVHKFDNGYYKEWLLGRIMYIRTIESITGEKMLNKFNELNWL